MARLRFLPQWARQVFVELAGSAEFERYEDGGAASIVVSGSAAACRLSSVATCLRSTFLREGVQLEALVFCVCVISSLFLCPYELFLFLLSESAYHFLVSGKSKDGRREESAEISM